MSFYTDIKISVAKSKPQDGSKNNYKTDRLCINLIASLLCCANARSTLERPRLYYDNKAKLVQY